jgi:glycosidase
MRTKFILWAGGSFLLALFFYLSCPNVYASENTILGEATLDLTGGWYSKNEPENVGSAQDFLDTDEGWAPFTMRDYWTRHSIRRDGAGVTWYARKFSVENPTDDLILYVSGVDNDASFYLNGKLVGISTGYSEDGAFAVGTSLNTGENILTARLNRSLGTENIYGPISLVRKDNLAKVARLDSSLETARRSVSWVKNAVVYELYPRSFSKDESFKSVIKQIPELKKLGATVLWLMPIHPIGKLNRKGTLGSPYSVRDYYKINPEYGTLDDFKELVKAVHQSGMHIIIDLVINHTAWDNALITEHPEWYVHDSTGKIIPPNPDWTDVAQLDYSNKNLREYMVTMMKYWVGDIGIDGFRCDVAEMVPVDFWDEARAALDSIKPVMMLAEGARPDLHLKAFDLTYSWSIYDVLQKIFAGTTPASAIDRVLERESRVYPKGALHLRFNTNHDKNAYDGPSIERYGSAGDSLTIALIATLPGVPLIYNGDEVGNPEKLSLFEQVPINWNNDGSFRNFYEKIFSLRKSHGDIRYGSYRVLPTNDTRDILAFERKTGNDKAVCVFNFAATKKSNIEIDVNGRNGLNFIDGITGQQFQIKNGRITVSLAKYGFLILMTGK